MEMKSSKFKALLAIILAVSVALSFALTAFAEPGNEETSIEYVDFDESTEPEVTDEPEISETDVSEENTEDQPSEPESTEEPSTEQQPSTEPVTEPVTEPATEPATEPVTEPVTETTTEKKTTSPNVIYIPTLRPPVEPEYPEETEEKLPEGSFYVYLELNNSEDRLKHVLDAPGIVPQPEEPVREGYVFDGWYADEEFTELWDFDSDIAYEGTVIFAKWIPEGSTVEYAVTVVQTPGGKLTVHPSKARAGETVVITPAPDDGKRLVFGSVTINGKSTDILNFKMPAENVTIQGVFEDIPVVTEEEKEYSTMFYVSLAVVLLLLGVSVFLVIRRKRIFKADMAEWNNDNSAEVVDGFKDGQKVFENDKDEPEVSLSLDGINGAGTEEILEKFEENPKDEE